MKKIISLIFALLMVAMVLPLAAFTTSAEESDYSYLPVPISNAQVIQSVDFTTIKSDAALEAAGFVWNSITDNGGFVPYIAYSDDGLVVKGGTNDFLINTDVELNNSDSYIIDFTYKMNPSVWIWAAAFGFTPAMLEGDTATVNAALNTQWEVANGNCSLNMRANESDSKLACDAWTYYEDGTYMKACDSGRYNPSATAVEAACGDAKESIRIRIFVSKGTSRNAYMTIGDEHFYLKRNAPMTQDSVAGLVGFTFIASAREYRGVTLQNFSITKCDIDYTAYNTYYINILDGHIADVNKRIEAGERSITAELASFSNDIDEAKAYYETQPNEELKAKIEEAEKTLASGIAVVEKNLDNAVSALESTIENGYVSYGEKWIALIEQIADATRVSGIIDADKLTNARQFLNNSVPENTQLLCQAVEKAIAEDDLALVSKVANLEPWTNELLYIINDHNHNYGLVQDCYYSLMQTISTAHTHMQSKLDTAQDALINVMYENNSAIKAKMDELNKVLSQANEWNSIVTEALVDVAGAEETLNVVNVIFVQNELVAATEALEKAVDDGDKALDTKISALDTALKAAEEAYKTADGTLKTELSTKIETADAALDAAIKAVQKNLDDAKTALEKAISDGDKALDTKIAALDTALKAAEAAYKTADGTLKTELSTKIETADAALDAAIKAVQKNLDDAKTELEKALSDEIAKLREEMTKADDKTQTTQIVLGSVAGVAVAGDISLLAWLLLKRKKGII